MFKHLSFVGLAALTLVGSGCVKDVGSVKVDGVCALTDDCSFPADGCEAFFITRPVIDVSLTSTLRLFLNVTNQLDANGGGGALNTHDAYVDRISTSYSVVDPGFSLGGSITPTVGTIFPESTSTVEMYVIDEDAGARLAALAIPAWNPLAQNFVDMVAHISVEGHFVDGETFTTEPYDLAFRVCRGCITPCAGGAVCPPGNNGQIPIVCASATP
jgi:hypothetical protein